MQSILMHYKAIFQQKNLFQLISSQMFPTVEKLYAILKMNCMNLRNGVSSGNTSQS